MFFSYNYLYKKDKEEILSDAKLYIDTLEKNILVKEFHNQKSQVLRDSHAGLHFRGLSPEIKEFKEFLTYTDKKINEAWIENDQNIVKELLGYLDSDTEKFYNLLVPTGKDNHTYHDIPVLKNIDTKIFCEKIASPLSPRQIYLVSKVFKERYTQHNLKEEKEWLIELKEQFEIQIEAQIKESDYKLSSHVIRTHLVDSLSCAIENLGEASDPNSTE